MKTPTRYTGGEDNTASPLDANENRAELIAAQRLSSALLPPKHLRRLLSEVEGVPSRVLTLGVTQLRSAPFGLTEKQIERFQEAANAPLPEKFEEIIRNQKISVLLWNDPTYPELLSHLEDAPPLLFVRGHLPEAGFTGVAIVGSRRASGYGCTQAARFATEFVRHGLVVVSGGAAGVDTAAHKGALEGGGKTVVVLGCGVNHAYPAANRSLFARVVEAGGAIISEFPVGATPEPWRFPARNRIIAGICKATIVVESPKDSGALITAKDASDYNRLVFAIPDSIENDKSRGCHDLIREGAILAASPEDVLEDLGVLSPEAVLARKAEPDPAQRPTVEPASKAPKNTPVAALKATASTGTATAAAPVSVAPSNAPVVPLSENEQRLLLQLAAEPRHLDEASAVAGLSAAEAGVAATLLEMKGLIQRRPGNLFLRIS